MTLVSRSPTPRCHVPRRGDVGTRFFVYKWRFATRSDTRLEQKTGAEPAQRGVSTVHGQQQVL